MMTSTSDKTVLSSKNIKNELFYNYPPRIGREYIAPACKLAGKRVTFQAAMKLTIIIGQCFGLNPVLGVCEKDTSKLRFTFWSGRCFYSILSILGQSVMVCTCLMKLLKDTGGSMSSNASLVFFVSNCFTAVLFLQLAMKWPKFCQLISQMEGSDPNNDSLLIRKCNVSIIIIFALATIEHLLSNLSGIARVIDCQPGKEIYEAFILQCFPWVWTFVSYNTYLAVIVQFVNLQCTCNWNFADGFIICISWYLTARLKQVNNRIMAVRGKYVPPSYWRIMREDYSRATYLVKKADEVVSGIIFISFANNLFFICLQLLHTLDEGIKVSPGCHRTPDYRPMRGYEQAVYFVYSFTFLVARFLAVSLCAARIHTASREPAQALYDVPSTTYCTEVQRFLHQVQGDSVALSGLQFFNIKRGIVLTIAGTIVTYELVLMQFAGVSPTASSPILEF